MPPHLFEPTVINRLQLKNRIVRSATWEGTATGDGRPTVELVRLYRELARGGVGLIVTGFVYVAPEGKPLPGALGLHDDGQAEALTALIAAVHTEGGKICAQLGHAGGQTRASLCGGQPLAPSAIAAPQYHPETPREMSVAEIASTIEAFASAAARARECGFDAVQLLASHGYLLSQFLSPHTNRRQDGYGGDLAGRSRLLLEVCRRVRETVGADYPLLVKLNGSDNLEGGFPPDEAIAVARALEKAGVDAIEVSSGTPASGECNPLRRGIDSREKEGYNLPLAAAVKRAVGCPVIVVGGIRSYWSARRIVHERQADYIALSRPLIREPDLPLRWRRADADTLSRCISCNACFKAALKGSFACTAAQT